MVWEMLRFEQSPTCEGAAEWDERFFEEAALELLPSRLLIEFGVIIEGGRRRGGVDIAWDGHGGWWLCRR